MQPIDFHRIFDVSPNAYMLVDADLRYVAANKAYLAVTSSKLEELIGRKVLDAFPHDEKNPENENARLLRASFEKVLATGRPDVIAVISYRVAREFGGPPEERFWSATHTPLLDASGKVAHILQHTVEVTELERLKAAATASTADLRAIEAGVLGRARLVQQANVTLDEEIRRLRRLFEQAPGFICILNGPDHVFEIANPAYSELVGGKRDLIGKPVREALPEVVEQGFIELLDRVYQTGEPYVGRAVTLLLQRTPNDPPKEVTLDFVYQPILGPHGNVVGIFVQGNDISEQRRALIGERAARAEAERANRLKDEFLATVSHELRTPLTAILGWLDILRANQGIGTEHRERAVDTIERNARTLSQLVEDILDVSRITSGKMDLEVQPVRLADVADGALDAVRPAADAKSIRLQSTVDSNAFVMGDPKRLQQIIWNLLSNAVKFTQKAGRVQMTVARRDSYVVVTIADNGMGIDADFLPHVFERFRQGEGGSARKHGGLGLGLAIAKHLVELHGGTISAESDGPGKGTSFVVLLPVSLSRQVVRPAVADAPNVDCPPEVVGLRVLVVEDEDDTRDLLREILTGFGVIVEVAATAAEGLAAYERSTPDVLISDIGMPDEDGYTLIRRLRALSDARGGHPRIPAIALTAFARTEDRTKALRAGFRAHVPKPINVGELLAVLASLAPSRS